ncbi:MAG: FliH/SctL family protein [Acidimicrobiales bacterium]
MSASPAQTGTSDILIRGDEAARAKPIDLVSREPAAPLNAVGPWAEQLNALHESARLQGFEKGRAEGHSVGVEQGRQAVTDMGASLAASVDKLLTQLEAQAAELGARLATETVDLALQIAEAVLGREIACTDDPGAEAIARCLEMAPATGDLFARLNPQDAAELGRIDGLADRGLMITADPSLRRGDAVVTINDATIDARLSESLRRVAEALR